MVALEPFIFKPIGNITGCVKFLNFNLEVLKRTAGIRLLDISFWHRCSGREVRGDKVASDIVLRYPVHSLENRLLLPAGAVLSDSVLDELISRAEDHSGCFLLHYGTVKKDLLHFLSEPPYQRIFHDSQQKMEMLRMMERVYLVLPVLRSLDYFKKYDYHTYKHMLMVFALSEMLAKELIFGFHAKEPETISSPTHDIGKTCVPLSILMKKTPGPRCTN